MMSSHSQTCSDEEDVVLKSFHYYEAQVAQKIHHFYISDVIGEPSKYIDMVHAIKMAGPNDVIYIYLNTPGGQLNTGLQIISAMNMSQAHIVTVLEGEVCSLGTFIFLSGDEFIVHDHCMFMIHNYSGGAFGKGHEQVAQVTAYEMEFGKFARDIYLPFLSEDEVVSVMKGEDLWMGSEEVRVRLNVMITAIEKERLANERRQNEPQKKKVAKKKVAKKKAKKKTS